MRTDTIEFTIPDFFLSALINGDVSGLEDAEIEAVDDLEEQARDCVKSEGASHYHWSTRDDEEPSFTNYHDARGIGACNCVDVDLVIFFDD